MAISLSTTTNNSGRRPLGENARPAAGDPPMRGGIISTSFGRVRPARPRRGGLGPASWRCAVGGCCVTGCGSRARWPLPAAGRAWRSLHRSLRLVGPAGRRGRHRRIMTFDVGDKVVYPAPRRTPPSSGETIDIAWRSSASNLVCACLRRPDLQGFPRQHRRGGLREVINDEEVEEASAVLRQKERADADELVAPRQEPRGEAQSGDVTRWPRWPGSPAGGTEPVHGGSACWPVPARSSSRGRTGAPPSMSTRKKRIETDQALEHRRGWNAFVNVVLR